MKKSRLIIFLLSLSLVLSNAWWSYQTLDLGLSYHYLQESFQLKSAQLTQTLSMLPVVANPDASKDDVISSARLRDRKTTPYEKEGFVWVDRLGLQFNDEGRLIKAVDGPQ